MSEEQREAETFKLLLPLIMQGWKRDALIEYLDVALTLVMQANPTNEWVEEVVDSYLTTGKPPAPELTAPQVVLKLSFELYKELGAIPQEQMIDLLIKRVQEKAPEVYELMRDGAQKFGISMTKAMTIAWAKEMEHVSADEVPSWLEE